jgi:hypothetical protein
MANSKQHRYSNSFKHEVCQYYTHHTGAETQAKYNVDPRSVCRWRVALGYNNKYRSYNLYTQTMQPALKKSQQRDFMVTKKDNAFLLDELTKLRVEMVSKDFDYARLENYILDAFDYIKQQREI